MTYHSLARRFATRLQAIDRRGQTAAESFYRAVRDLGGARCGPGMLIFPDGSTARWVEGRHGFQIGEPAATAGGGERVQRGTEGPDDGIQGREPG